MIHIPMLQILKLDSNFNYILARASIICYTRVMKKTIFKFFIYIRKSTDDKKGKRQVLSLDAQLRELRKLVSQENLVVVSIVEESQTAKEPGRPLFNRMLDRIEAGEANGILIWDIDRLYRNPADDGRVRWLLQR